MSFLLFGNQVMPSYQFVEKNKKIAKRRISNFVEFFGRHYIPRQHNKVIANMMDGGIQLKSNVRYINLEDSDWNRVYFKLVII